MKEGGGLVGGTCEHCEDRAPSGPRQDSVRTLSGLCQDSVRTLSGLSGQVREVHKPGFARYAPGRQRLSKTAYHYATTRVKVKVNVPLFIH